MWIERVVLWIERLVMWIERLVMWIERLVMWIERVVLWIERVVLWIERVVLWIHSNLHNTIHVPCTTPFMYPAQHHSCRGIPPTVMGACSLPRAHGPSQFATHGATGHIYFWRYSKPTTKKSKTQFSDVGRLDDNNGGLGELVGRRACYHAPNDGGWSAPRSINAVVCTSR
jgi:hypothetical protein